MSFRAAAAESEGFTPVIEDPRSLAVDALARWRARQQEQASAGEVVVEAPHHRQGANYLDSRQRSQ
jgi:hypothetical protein